MIFIANMLVIAALVALGYLFQSLIVVDKEVGIAFIAGMILNGVICQVGYLLKHGHWFEPDPMSAPPADPTREARINALLDGVKDGTRV